MALLYSKSVITAILLGLFSFANGCMKSVDRCQQPPTFNGINQVQLEADIKAIDTYLLENNIDGVKKHPSGIRYVVFDEGSGSSPDLCSEVTVTYMGKLMATDKVVDHSTQPVSAPLNQLIDGWQVGLSLLNKGGSIVLYIPSVYGYGADSSDSNIPKNSNLIFHINLIDIN